MEVVVCVKRVPATAGKITLTEDEVDTKFLSFAVSPHEECAVEEAVRLVEAHGGSSTVLTLGPAEAADQLRDALAMGIGEAVLLETDGTEWDAVATARAISDAVSARREQGRGLDLLLFGNESADTGDFQVGVRVAHALDLPCVTGVKALQIADGRAVAKRQVGSGWEVFEVDLPAVLTIKEGINLPRYPSVPGRLRAKKKEIERIVPERRPAGPERLRLHLPPEQERGVQILGTGPEAAPKVVEILREIGVMAR